MTKYDVIILIKVCLRQKMTSNHNPLHDLSHFQSMEGNFSKKGERHEQTQRLSGHVRTNPASYGGQARYFFAVIQQQRNRQDPI